VSEIHPRPKQSVLNGATISVADGVILHADTISRSSVERILLPELNRAEVDYRWSDGNGSGYAIHVGEPLPRDESPAPDLPFAGDEAYRITVTPEGASICGNSDRGTLYGLMTFTQMLARSGLVSGYVADGPDFAHRGIVEGFYGRTYSHETRIDLIEYAALLKMNTYLYGPKDDPYHRLRWRERYDAQSMKEFAEAVEQADALGMDFGWAAGPGFTVRYSDARDVNAMVGKLMQLADVGVRLFALFYDDIFGTHQHAEDQNSFGSLARAQADFTCRVWERLSQEVPNAVLLVCPTEYWGDAGSDYIVELASGIPAEIPLLWTGANVCSRTLSRPDSHKLAERLGRAPAYWDNYPVNDASMVFQLHTGPVRGRDADLGAACWGLLANPMNLAEASKIPLFTIAEYLWNSGDYDPELSWRSALHHVDPVCAEAWQLLLDHMHGSCLTDEGESRLDRLVTEYNETCRDGTPTLAPFVAYLDDLTAAYERVSKNDANGRLVSEVSPWLGKLCSLQALATQVIAILAMALQEVPIDRNIVTQFRRCALQDIERLRDRFSPCVDHRAIEALALRAMAVSEDIVRKDIDSARNMMNEPILMAGR